MRPASISGDLIGDYDVLIHALEETESLDKRQYDVIVMLQPTSPLRTPDQVICAIQMLVDEDWDSVWTVSPTDSKGHPVKQLTVDDGMLEYYELGGAEIVARQQLKPVYHRNGIAYVMTRGCLKEQRTVKGARTGALIVEGEHISIDTEWDLALAELMLTRRVAGQ
jgi:CMP-N-acetylneuraminic acid synthetase